MQAYESTRYKAAYRRRRLVDQANNVAELAEHLLQLVVRRFGELLDAHRQRVDLGS